MGDKKLNQREENYTQYLFEGLSQRKAYRKAFPGSVKWKDGTVDVRASQVASKDKIIIRLTELRAEADERSQVTHEMITEELRKIAFFDIGELFDDNGNLKDVHDMSITARKTISSIKVRKEFVGSGEDKEVHYITEVKLNGKDQSIDKLSKHVGYYEKDNNQRKSDITFENETLMKIREKVCSDKG